MTHLWLVIKKRCVIAQRQKSLDAAYIAGRIGNRAIITTSLRDEDELFNHETLERKIEMKRIALLLAILPACVALAAPKKAVPALAKGEINQKHKLCPRLLVTTSNGLVSLKLNDKGVYVKDAQAVVPRDADKPVFDFGATRGEPLPRAVHVQHVAMIGDYVYIQHEGVIRKLDSALKEVARVKIKEKDDSTMKLVGAGKASSKGTDSMAADVNGLYVSYGGDFICYDVDLKEVARIELEVSAGKKKNAHDILVHNGTAFLLDNVMYPIYVFTVDVSKLAEAKIVHRTELQGINHHLVSQWLSDKSSCWYILSSSSHRGGRNQEVNYARFDGKKLKFIEAESPSWFWSRRGGETKGTSVLAVTKSVPAWAVLKEKNNQFLAKCDPDKEGNVFVNAASINFRVSQMHGFDGYLYCLSGSTLKIISTHDTKVKQVMEVNLTKLGCSGAGDVLPWPAVKKTK
ncbi:MAG TPA: hypothetical protein ENL03_05970 [Phycisphaerae bacterium]|nr:hypothetical protein [Phycisphaerae bacterium]